MSSDGTAEGCRVQAGLTLERMGLWLGAPAKSQERGPQSPGSQGVRRPHLTVMGIALVGETTTLGETPASTVSWRHVGAEGFIQGTPWAPDPQKATMSASRLSTWRRLLLQVHM